LQHSRPQRPTQRSNVGHAQIGTFFGSRAPISAQKFKGKHGKTTGVTQNLRKKIEKFIEI